MILKIKREGNNLDGLDWWMLDSIRKISISKVRTVPVEGFPTKEAESEFWDKDLTVFDMCDPDVPRCAGANYKHVICRLQDGNEYSIIFDTYAYLLNDGGKTIDCISVPTKV